MSYGITDVIQDAFTGNLVYAQPEKVLQRKTICKTCEHLVSSVMFNNTTGTCGKCGCFIDSKTTLEKTSCPLLKW